MIISNGRICKVFAVVQIVQIRVRKKGTVITRNSNVTCKHYLYLKRRCSNKIYEFELKIPRKKTPNDETTDSLIF